MPLRLVHIFRSSSIAGPFLGMSDPRCTYCSGCPFSTGQQSFPKSGSSQSSGQRRGHGRGGFPLHANSVAPALLLFSVSRSLTFRSTGVITCMQFKKFQDAFNRITAILEEEEQEKSYKYITYTCIVTKVPPSSLPCVHSFLLSLGRGQLISDSLRFRALSRAIGWNRLVLLPAQNAGETGLGLIVIEDAAKKTIKIKSILPAVKAEEFSAEAKGRMLVGDVLIGVGVENVERMPLTRGRLFRQLLGEKSCVLAQMMFAAVSPLSPNYFSHLWLLSTVGQKLNETRVPAGSRVKLTFRRRLYLDGREVGADTASENADEATGTEGPQPPSPSNPPAQDGEFDIDETIRTFPEEEGGDAGEEGAEEGEAGDEEPTASSAAHPHGHAASGLSSGAGAVATPASGRAAASGGAAKRPSVSRGSVGQVQLLSENEELKAELFLAKDDVDSMRQTLQSLQLENEQLKHHVQRQASSLATDSLRQQAYLPHIVRQVATAEHVHNLRLHLQEVTQYVLTQQTLPVGAELEAYLTAEQLSLTECAVDVQKLAQRGAISALALGDVSGKALYRWQQQGDSAAAKLRRFADKMNTLSLPSS